MTDVKGDRSKAPHEQADPDLFVPNTLIFTDGEVDFAATLVERFRGYHRQNSRVRIGRADANRGQLFLNRGRGQFQYVPMAASGLLWTGDVRDLATVKLGKKTALLVGATAQPV